MDHELLHRKIVDNCEAVQAWFREKGQGLAFPFYSSFDLRDAGFKLGPVDAKLIARELTTGYVSTSLNSLE